MIDGMKSLFGEFSAYKIQMCQYHMIQIVRRYLTWRPRLLAARELKVLVDNIVNGDGAEFENKYRHWKSQWVDMLNRRSTLKSGDDVVHTQAAALRHAQRRLLPVVPFTYQLPECVGMTNNKIEGTFTDLEKNLNNHSGMSKENRKQSISVFLGIG